MTPEQRTMQFVLLRDMLEQFEAILDDLEDDARSRDDLEDDARSRDEPIAHGTLTVADDFPGEDEG